MYKINHIHKDIQPEQSNTIKNRKISRFINVEIKRINKRAKGP